ncbi:MAG: hypothetical protein H8E82_04865 [Candidatus Marinimicrobia bacterium]|nr:hypothetical protein [Candidatus Neomarinimicrobiota bacterium]
MKYESLIKIFADRQWIETQEVAFWFDEPLRQIQVRLSRWVQQGKLIQLRKGKYLLPEVYHRKRGSTYTISNYLYSPSYVSQETALEYYGIIPESVSGIQSVTTRPTKEWNTPIGKFYYHHIKQERFFGYQQVNLMGSETFYCATPEKALTDLLYFKKGEWTKSRIQEMRLQNLEQIDLNTLNGIGDLMNSKKVIRAIKTFSTIRKDL